MAPGRNEPCPCGSGRKFKHCCGAVTAASTATPTHADRDAAWDLLDRLSCLPRFRDDVALAHALIWGDVPDDEADALMDTAAGDLFFEWMWLDHVLHTGQTFAEYALAKHTADLGPGGRAFLRACVEAPLRLLQVTRVEPGARVHVRDVVDRGDVMVVVERAGSQQLVRHDVLTARIAGYGDDSQFEGMSLLFGVDDKQTIAKQIRRLRKPLATEVPQRPARDRVMRMATGAAIVRSAIGLFDRPQPHVTTADGDDLVFANAIFAVLDAPAVKAALEQAENIELDDEAPSEPGVLARFAWLEMSQGKDHQPVRVLGAISLGPTALRVETISLARARRAQDHFSALVPGTAMQFKGIQTQSVQSLLQQTMDDDDERPEKTARESNIDPAIAAGIERDYMEQYYREWLDSPVPALGNRTPREAARIKHLRSTLRTLVESIENQAERGVRDGHGFDVAFLRAELGLT